jgi:hypothetical protein
MISARPKEISTQKKTGYGITFMRDTPEMAEEILYLK